MAEILLPIIETLARNALRNPDPKKLAEPGAARAKVNPKPWE
jgi:hypothetical protein